MKNQEIETEGPWKTKKWKRKGREKPRNGNGKAVKTQEMETEGPWKSKKGKRKGRGRWPKEMKVPWKSKKRMEAFSLDERG